MNLRHLLALLALLLLTSLAGCGGSPLVNARGRLTCKGQPVPSTYVYFWPEEEGKRRSTGLTDDDGNFTLHFSRTESGVLPGKHTVYLRYNVSAEEEQHLAPPKASHELREIIAKYPDYKTSPLHFEITRSGQFIEVKID